MEPEGLVFLFLKYDQIGYETFVGRLTTQEPQHIERQIGQNAPDFRVCRPPVPPQPVCQFLGRSSLRHGLRQGPAQQPIVPALFLPPGPAPPADLFQSPTSLVSDSSPFQLLQAPWIAGLLVAEC